jgi:hypothetical protein
MHRLLSPTWPGANEQKGSLRLVWTFHFVLQNVF